MHISMRILSWQMCFAYLAASPVLRLSCPLDNSPLLSLFFRLSAKKDKEKGGGERGFNSLGRLLLFLDKKEKETSKRRGGESLIYDN